MRYKKVLFCIPPVGYGRPRGPFVGVGYLSTFLLSEGIPNEVIDMNLGYGLGALFRKITAFKPDLVGFSFMTYNYKNTYKIMNEVKRRFDVDIVAGGAHASTLRKELLEECPAIDFAVKLEGEYTLRELILGRKYEDIDGLIYRKGSDIIENGDRKFILNLDIIPFPTYAKFELNKYFGNVIPIISSRGCPYNCIYCPVKAAIGRTFRVRSAESTVEEIDYWYRMGYRIFEFLDDNFTLYKDRVITICNLIKERNLKDIIFNCPNGVRVDSLDKELLTVMRSTGFKRIALGVEAGNNKILKNLKKGVRIEVIEEVIKEACEIGFDVTLFFLIGSPGESTADVEDSIRLALRYPIVNAFFYNIVPYPKTELYEWISKNNYLIKAPSEYLSSAAPSESDVFFATPEFSLEERKRMLVYAKRIQKEIRRKSITRRFLGNRLLGRIGAMILTTSFAERYLFKQRLFWKFYNQYVIKHYSRKRAPSGSKS